MSAPLLAPKQKGVRTSVSPGRQPADAAKPSALFTKSISDALNDEPPKSGKHTKEQSTGAPQLPQIALQPPLRNPGRAPEVPKRLPKDRSSGGMDGQNNRSLDFFETDSSEDDQGDRSNNVSPRSIATLDKTPGLSVSGPSQSQKTQNHDTNNATVTEAFDFGLDAQKVTSQESKNKSRAEALASLDPRPTPHKTVSSPNLDRERLFQKEEQPYPEVFVPFEDPRPLGRKDLHPRPVADVDAEDDSTSAISGYDELVQRGYGSDRVLTGWTLTLNSILEQERRHRRGARNPWTPTTPTRPKCATSAARSSQSPFRYGAGSGWVPAPLPPIKPLDPNKEALRSSLAKPTAPSKDAPLPSRPGILRTPSWGLSSNRTKRRSVSSPEPSQLSKSQPPLVPPIITTDAPRHGSVASKPQTILGAEHKPSQAEMQDASPLTPYPDTQAESSDDSDHERSHSHDAGHHLAPHEQTPISTRSPSVRIVEPPQTFRDPLGQARRATLSARRRSSVINTEAVSADTILALSVRRQHGPNGRRFVRLVVPADEEIATPSHSQRASIAAGRKQSIASTDPEKSQDGKESENAKPNEKAEFDDAAFFRELRKAYYNELLGSTIWSRFFRRYCSAYVLKRITLVSGDGLVDPDPPNITPATRSTRFLTIRGFNDVESEDSLLHHFQLPGLGRASWRWVRWVHRVAVNVDQDNAEFEAKMRKVSLAPEQRISAVPGGMEFIEGPGVGRLMTAVAVVLVGSVLATVLYVGLGPVGSSEYTLEAITVGTLQLPQRGAADRVVQGVLLGQFVLWFGVVVVACWIVVSSLVT